MWLIHARSSVCQRKLYVPLRHHHFVDKVLRHKAIVEKLFKEDCGVVVRRAKRGSYSPQRVKSNSKFGSGHLIEAK